MTAVTSDREALLTVARSWQRLLPHRRKIDRLFVAIVAGLHLLAAFTLTFAPRVQLFTAGTTPALDLMPAWLWALLFLIGGLAASSLLWTVTGPRQVVTWGLVLPTQAMWLGASLIAVSRGGGTSMGVVFLSAVIAWTIATALVTAHDFISGKR